jgi:hypothetical protein
MPIFFMLPFIILQGMIEVAFDDVKEKPKGTLIPDKRLSPAK